MIDQVHPAEVLEDKVLEFAEQILKKSPIANAGIKQVIQSIIDGENEETKEIENIVLDSYSSEDYKEGIQAFLEKRKPNFL